MPERDLSVKRECGQPWEEVLGRKGQFSPQRSHIQEHGLRQGLDSRFLAELARQALVIAHGLCAEGKECVCGGNNLLRSYDSSLAFSPRPKPDPSTPVVWGEGPVRPRAATIGLTQR